MKSMRQKDAIPQIGKDGEKVSNLGYGCMRLPTLEGAPEKIDEKKAIELLRYAIDTGKLC
jgi:predicted aldo/keto reductase-like oxidoreductase